MDRRHFLSRTALLVGGVGAAGVLAACGRSAGGESHSLQARVTGGAAGVPEGEPTLAPQVVTFELLTGDERTVPFGLRTLENVEVADADVEVFLRDVDGEVRAGPFPAEYTEAAGEGLGLYKTSFALDEPGQLEFVAVVGDDYGTQVVNVVAPEDSKAPVPGQQAVVVATPTEDKPRGMAQLCTQDPPCGMHEVSLDDALADGRKVVLLFATPAYCVSATCGPAVGTVDEVRTGGEWADTAWIHVEIYSDAGQTVSDPVQAWKLPTEPWMFTIGADGAIVDRLDGAMLPEMVADLAAQLQQT